MSKELVDLMREVQQDELAFALLTARLFAEGENDVTYGKLLTEFGDPRQWPEYKRRIGETP